MKEAVHNIATHYPNSILSEVHYLGETTLQVAKENLLNILSYLKKQGFEVLMDLTGVDYISPTKKTKVVYWLHDPTHLDRVRITVHVNRDESLPTVTHLWQGADWYERELYDLFGVTIEGHPDLKRILMPDDWQGHPLRRDYALTEESVEFKHNVKPKVPSRIIPDDRDETNKLF